MQDEQEARLERTWRFLDTVRECNSFLAPTSSRAQCRPFRIDGVAVGSIRPDVAVVLERHPDVFAVSSAEVTFAEALRTEPARSAAIRRLLEAWRAAGTFTALAGWRDELYPVVLDGSVLHAPLALQLERTGVGIFGFTSYGVHINGYTRTRAGELRLWIARRSPTKQTWPNYLDNFVAGGQPVGVGLLENVLKECAEEASVPAEIAARARPVGAVSYTMELPRGIYPELQYVYDLELPETFTPTPQDGEVGAFYLWTVAETIEHMQRREFKPNCALVLIDFFVRWGLLDPATEPDFVALVQGCHATHPFAR